MSKATPEILKLHKGLLEGDETASAELFVLFYDELVRYFIKAFGDWMDVELIKDQVSTAFIKLIDQPEKYNPAKAPLKSYLQMDIRGNIFTFLKKKSPKLVELTENIQNSIYSKRLENQVISKDLVNKVKIKLKSLFPEEPDFEVAWNMICGERSTEIFAKILAIEQLPSDQQKKEVKRNKDRINKQLQRNNWQGFLKSLR